jgi:hypothetical protein
MRRCGPGDGEASAKKPRGRPPAAGGVGSRGPYNTAAMKSAAAGTTPVLAAAPKPRGRPRKNPEAALAAAASPAAEVGPARCCFIARHVVQRTFNPSLLHDMASYDVVSNIWHTLRGGVLGGAGGGSGGRSGGSGGSGGSDAGRGGRRGRGGRSGRGMA